MAKKKTIKKATTKAKKKSPKKNQKKLVVVESPNKIQKIQKFLGSDYHVMASVGHFMDLKKRGGINVKQDFHLTYAIDSNKREVVNNIKKAVKNASEVYLFTDPDREGAAIAFSIKQVLKGAKVPFLRATTTEITKQGVLDAIKKAYDPELEINLVRAQQTRRVIDRLTGFRVSPMLWSNVKNNTSAGRVQSVALKLIVERQREIDEFKPEEYWTLEVDVAKQTGEQFTVKYIKDLKNKAETDKILNSIKGRDPVVKNVVSKTVNKNPYAPFTTSTMQQVAGSIYNWTAKRTMEVAQQLYEQGLITYHRTDSTMISSQALSEVRDYINNQYGAKYLPKKANTYKSKSKNSQEAHECIRPTDVKVTSAAGGDPSRLYEIIRSRFQSCQMSAAQFDTVTVDVEIDIYPFRANGQSLKFDGWLKIWNYGKSKETMIPNVIIKEVLSTKNIDPQQHFTQPPPRYNNSSLVKELESKGIGRPSTYASIIDTLMRRKYVDMLKGKAFVPTDLGKAVCEFLSKHFKKIIAIDFTANMEDTLDLISDGKETYLNACKKFYNVLIEEIKSATETISKDQTTVHKCPSCGLLLLEKLNRKTGEKFYGCSGYSDSSCTFLCNIGEDGKPEVIEKEYLKTPCPKCKGKLLKKVNRKTKQAFYACEGWRDGCKITADGDGNIRKPKKTKKTGKKCPQCKKGNQVERKGKNGPFLACDNFPKCRYTASK